MENSNPNPSEAENEGLSRRAFLARAAGWSKAAVGATLVGAALTVTPESAEARGGAWVNSRGGRGGGAWVNGGGGGAWNNRSGSWINGGGGNRGGAWVNAGGGGSWANGGYGRSGGAWTNRRGGGGAWVNR